MEIILVSQGKSILEITVDGGKIINTVKVDEVR